MKRIQRQRTKGWRMPEGAVYVGRPSLWGNPYRIGCMSDDPDGATPYSRADSLFMYRHRVMREVRSNPDYLAPLRGHDLACWCPLDQPCHADVLLKLAS